MRDKADYNLYQFAKIAKIYADIGQGTNIFWQELEEILLIKSASFKNLHGKSIGENGEDALLWVISSFAKANRPASDIFWQVFTQILQ